MPPMMPAQPETDFQATGSRPASLWPESVRQGDSTDFASKSGPQIRAVKAMVDRLSGAGVP